MLSYENVISEYSLIIQNIVFKRWNYIFILGYVNIKENNFEWSLNHKY